MGFEQNYIKILIESLQKKIQVLDNISAANEEQKALASEEKLDLEKLEPTLEKKQVCIDQLNDLDAGFEVLYQRVKTELEQHKEEHREEIRELKQLITQVTERSMKVQAEEERNRQAIQAHFGKYKKDIKKFNTSSKVVTNYYNAMNKLEHVDPQFMDKKK